MFDVEKAKRKEKPKRNVWRRRILIAYAIVIVVAAVFFGTAFLFPNYCYF